MKHVNSVLLFFSLVMAMLIQAASAQNLCSTACELTLNFTHGGTIEAIETLTITFGEGGFINDGAVTTGYAVDETLQLNAGETLLFGTGGAFSLGNSGNIDYSAMNLVTGDIVITALSGGSVSLHGNSSFKVDGTFELNSDLTLSAELDLSASTGTSSSGDVTLTSGTGTITVEPETSGSIMLANNEIISSSAPAIPLLEVNLVETPNVVTIAPVEVTPVETAPVEITTLQVSAAQLSSITQQDLIALEGVTIPLDDNNSCTIQNGVCIDSAGTTYELVEGKFVQIQGNTSGSLDLSALLFLFSMLM